MTSAGAGWGAREPAVPFSSKKNFMDEAGLCYRVFVCDFGGVGGVCRLLPVSRSWPPFSASKLLALSSMVLNRGVPTPRPLRPRLRLLGLVLGRGRGRLGCARQFPTAPSEMTRLFQRDFSVQSKMPGFLHLPGLFSSDPQVAPRTAVGCACAACNRGSANAQ